MKKKALVSVLSVALVLCFAAGATIAWLKDQTQEVKNTFTVGDVDIAMSETVGEELKNTDDTTSAIINDTYKMVPGATLSKDPKVIVNAGSEACWLFVTIDKSTNFDDFMTFDVADGWTLIDGETNVYYREVAATGADAQTFPVIKDNTVNVKTDVTKEMLNSLTSDTSGTSSVNVGYPTLTFKAYAVQKDYLTKADGSAVTTAADAWALAQ